MAKPDLDPHPYRVEVIDRSDTEIIAARDGGRLSSPAWTSFWDAATERLVFDPRPEFDQDPASYKETS